MSNQPKVVPYDPSWPQHYAREKELIETALGNLLIEIHHVGSTSVPGLAAKPLLDIIAVVKDAKTVAEPLKKAGYEFKGTFNIPLRPVFGKLDPMGVNLHVHEVGSPEIELNLKFRDHLRTHPEALEEYAALKFRLAKDKDANKRLKNGLRHYTVGKNDFITKIIEATGFKGICPRLCSHEAEWESYESLKPEDLKLDPHKEGAYPFILYEGAEIVAAAHVDLLPDHKAELKFLELKPGGKDAYKNHFMAFLNRWIQSEEYAWAE